MVAINDPMREKVIAAAKLAAIALYTSVDKDDTQFLQEGTQNFITGLSESPLYKAEFRQLLGKEPSDDINGYSDAAIYALIASLRDLAAKAGHTENAEYVSQAIKERFGE